MNRSKRAACYVLPAVLVLVIIAFPESFGVSNDLDPDGAQNPVLGGAESDVGVPAKFGSPFYEKIRKLASQESGSGGRSDTRYYDTVIVVPRYDADGNDIAGQQKSMVVARLEEAGAMNVRPAESLLFVTASVPVGKILGLSLHDEVYALGDGEVQLTVNLDKARPTIHATPSEISTSNGTIPDGSGVTVAVIDTGINHTSLNARVLHSVDCSNSGCNTVDSTTDDTNSHGTRVARIIGGADDMEDRSGIAPGVSLIDLTAPTGISVYHALDWAATNEAKVVNMSFSFGSGVDSCNTSAHSARTGELILEDAANNGIVISNSAGNSGKQGSKPQYHSISSPSCASNIIGVGGINDRGTTVSMYNSSSKGPYNTGRGPILKPDMVAPAVSIHVPGGNAGNGTSLSAPMVSAAAALMLGEDDTLGPAKVKAMLLLGANWTGPVPCTSVQYEQYDPSDGCSHAREPSDPAEANGSLDILNNVGFGILDVAKSLEYVRGGNHAVVTPTTEGMSKEYAFNVTGAEGAVKVILVWFNPSPATLNVQESGVMVNQGLYHNLDLEVNCPEMEAVDAGSRVQFTEFAVFTPEQAGTCRAVVTATDLVDSATGAEYVLASTRPLEVSTAGPEVLSAFFNNATGEVRISFDERINANPASVDPSKIYVRENGTSSGGIDLDKVEFLDVSDPRAVAFDLTEVQSSAVRALDSPSLSIDARAVRDISGNAIEAISNHDVEVISTSPPAFSSVTLDETTRFLVASFNDGIQADSINATKFHVREQGSDADIVTLFEEDLVAVTNSTLVFRLSTFEMDKLPLTTIPPTTLQLVADAGAVAAVPDIALDEAITADIPVVLNRGPKFSSAAFDNATGILTVAFDEVITSSVTSAYFRIGEAGTESSEWLHLNSSDTKIQEFPTKVSFNLTSANKEAILSLESPMLWLEEEAVSDTDGNTFDASGVSAGGLVGTYGIAGTGSVRGLTFGDGGNKAYVAVDGQVRQVALDMPFNMSGTPSATTHSLPPMGSSPVALAVNGDGTGMLVLEESGNKVIEYEMTTAFNAGSASSTGDSFALGTLDPSGLTIGADGRRVFIPDAFAGSIDAYDLAGSFDASSAEWAGSFSVAPQEASPTGLAIETDGKRMYVVGGDRDAVHQYTMYTPFDLSTASYDGVSLPVGDVDGSPEGLALDDDNSRIFVLGDDNDIIAEYALDSFELSVIDSRPAVSSATLYEESRFLEVVFNAPLIALDATQFHIGDQNSNIVDLGPSGKLVDGGSTILLRLSSPEILAVPANPVLVIDAGGVRSTTSMENADTIIHEIMVKPSEGGPAVVSTSFDAGTGNLTVTFDKTVDTSTLNATKFHIRVTDKRISQEVDLTEDELVAPPADSDAISFNLTEANRQDVISLSSPLLRLGSGAVTDSSGNPYDASFDVLAADREYNLQFDGHRQLRPNSLTLADNGQWMYIIRDNYVVPYSLSPRYNVSSATSAEPSFDVIDVGAAEGLAISDDGSRMFVLSNFNAAVLQYDLSNSFEPSSATPAGSSPPLIRPYEDAGLLAHDLLDLQFSADGRHMFVIRATTDAVDRFELASPFDAREPRHVDSFDSNTTAHAYSFAFGAEGTRLYLAGDGTVHQYTLFRPYDLETAAEDGFVQLGKRPYAGIDFNDDGHFMFILDGNQRRVHKYLLGTSPIGVTPDGTSPELLSASLDASKGDLTVTFDETIDISNLNATKFHIGAQGPSAKIDLLPEEIITASNSRAVTFELNSTRLALVPASPQLGLDQGAVSDTSGNPIGAVEGHPIGSLPAVFSIVRHDPAGQYTSDTSPTFKVTFNKPVTAVDASDFVAERDTQGGMSTITASAVSGSEYNVTVSVDTDGMLGIAVDAGSDITDTSGNPLASTAPLSDNEKYSIDTAAPAPMIRSKLPPVTNAQVLEFEVDFGEAIQTGSFGAGGINASSGTVSEPTTTDDTYFDFEVSGADEGPFEISIPAGAAADLAGNPSEASEPFAVTLDRIPPVITIPGSNPLTISDDEIYRQPVATCDGATATVESTDVPNPLAVGTYQVVYSCTDEAQNTVQETLTVEVYAGMPKFSSATLEEWADLTITFVAPVSQTDPSKIHLRAPNSPVDAITLSLGELGVSEDPNSIVFNLTEANQQSAASKGLSRLTLEGSAVASQSGDPFDPSYDISGAERVRVAEINTPSPVVPKGIAFNGNGNRMFIADTHGDMLHQYALDAVFDVGTLEHVAPSKTLPEPGGITFGGNGTWLFAASEISPAIHGFSLGSAFDIGDLDVSDAHSFAAGPGTATGVATSNDGMRLFVLTTGDNALYQYDMSTPFDVSTANASNPVTLSPIAGSPSDMVFSSDGTRMLVINSAQDRVVAYKMSTPFDISTASPAAGHLDVWRDGATSPSGIAFGNGGTRLFVANEEAPAHVFQYDLGVFDLRLKDTTRPGFSSAELDEDTGVLNISFDEAMKSGIVTLSKLIIKNSTSPPKTDLVGAVVTTTSDSPTISITLSEEQRRLVITMTAPTLTIQQGAVIDISGNRIDKFANNAITVTKDTAGPRFSSAELDEGLGVLSITFTEHVNASSVQPGKLFLRDETATARTGLDGLTPTTTSDSPTISITLSEEQRQSAIAMAVPVLDVDAGAVLDMSGNAAVQSAGNAIAAVPDAILPYVQRTFLPVLDKSTGTLNVTFTEPVDANAIVPSGFSIRQFGSGGDGVVMSGDQLQTVANSNVVSFALNATNIDTVRPLSSLQLVIKSSAIRDTSGNPIDFGFSVDASQYNKNHTVSGSSPKEMEFSGDGTHMFVIDRNCQTTRYDLNSPYEIESASSIESHTPQGIDDCTGLAFSGNGTRMFVTYGYDAGSTIHRYDMSVPFNVNAAVDASSEAIETLDNSPESIAFSTDGESLFVVGRYSNTVTMSPTMSAFDLPDTSGNIVSMSLNASLFRMGIAFSPDGMVMTLATSGTTDRIEQYQLDAPFQISGSDRSSDVISDLHASNTFPTDVAFDRNGGSMFVLDSQGKIFEYDLLPHGSYDIAVQNSDTTPPTFSSAEYATGSGNLTVTFSEDIGSTVDLAGLHVRESGSSTGGFALTGSTYSVSGATATFTLAQDQQDSLAALMTPHLDIDTGAVSDLSDNGIAAAPDGAITIDDATPPLPEGAFVTTWKTTTAGESISISVEVHAGETFTIDWGDGDTDPVTADTTASHTYSALGEYRVSMTEGLSRINLGNSTSTALKLASIDQWGDIGWSTMKDAFWNAQNMEYKATDAPDLSGATSMQDMFHEAHSFDGDLSGWDVSSIENMDGTFRNAKDFNGDVSTWNTSSATDMRKMFQGALLFDGDLSGWDTSGVTRMDDMFNSAGAFNQDISSWNTSSVIQMQNMFASADKFNQPLNEWDVSKVTDMSSMFDSAGVFDQPLNEWDVSSVTDMKTMFSGSPFSQNLGEWYIVPADNLYDIAEASLNVTTISAQNSELDDQSPNYSIGSNHDSELFKMTGTTLMFNDTPSAGGYMVNVTAPGGDFGTANHLVLDVTVSGEIGNTPPTVDAGNNQTAAEGSTVNLAGTASDVDTEDTLEYSWSHNSTLTITLDDVLGPSFTAPNVSEDTAVEFTLTVDDGTAQTSDSMTVTITDSANTAPEVNAGDDQTVAEGSTVNLAGTASDVDTEDTLEYSWSHNSTLTITLDDGEALDTSFTAPNVSEDTAVEFTLEVSDGTASVTDSMTVTITDSANTAPEVNAGDDQTVAEGSTVNLAGTASDVDTEDTLEYSWSHNSTLTITLDDGEALDTSFTAPNVSEDTAVEFTLEVSDGTASVTDSMTVTITDSANTAPTVNAGNNQEVAEGSTVNLAGTASDVDTEDTLEYSWSHNSTLTITLDDGEALDTSFTAPNVSEDTAVEFTLTVDDGTAQTSDSMTVTITDSANTAPTVDAGNNQTAAEGSTVNLAGTASDVDTEDTLEYSWSHNSTLTITLDDVLGPSFTAPNVSEDTAVEFTLTVDDGTAQTSDSMTVTITDSANTAPTVDAGNNQTAAEGSTVNLAGTASDVDTEDTLEYSWSHNSTLTITLDDVLGPSFTAPNVSEDTAVEFTLTVDDGTAQTSDSMTVTITDSANTAPTVDAGNNQTAAEGSTVNLAGTASDVDTEDTLEYSWSHNSTLTITLDDVLGPSFTAPNVSEDTAVEFTLTVDDGTAQTSDSMTVTITDSANTAPTVDAGDDQTAAEGSTVNLAGTASDVDTEDTLEYSWSHNSTLTITLDDVLGPSFTAPNVSEDTAVEFTLTVDDGTAQTSDSMTVTITDSANTAPTVDAGDDQTAAEGSTVNLAGTASDVDTEDTLEYSWSHNSTLTITLDDVLGPSFTAPNVSEDTAVEFTLTVDDGTAQTSDSMTVTITDSANTAPTVDAGNNQTAAEGSTVNLAGTASDVDTEDTLEYSWSHNSTLTITLDDVLGPSFTAPNVSEDTAVEFTLTVDDGTAQTSDSMTVTITDSANTAPTVDAGNNQTAAEGSTVNLAGTASDVDTEDTLEYSWSHNSTLTITLDDGEALDTSFTAPNVSEDTAVEFTLTVDDGTAQTSDSMTVTITDSANTAPTVDAGNNQEVAEGSTVNLAGTASDVDTEDTLEYSWSHNSTLTITLDDGEALDTSFTAPNVSEDTAVEFTLTVDDGTAQTSDSMTVTITDSANTAPTVDAGNNQEVAEGSTVNLAGTASDVDTEDTLEYSWSHNSTLTITLDDGEALDTSFTAPNVSEDTAVEFTLTVDDGTAQTSDSMTVTITDSANTAPTVDAGNNQTAAEGSTVNLAGTASDVDTEDTLEYSWSHNSTLTITLDDVLGPSFTAPNVSEDTAVEFTLTVDDGTAQTSDSMTVTITDSANTAPTVDAGDDQTAAEGSTVNLAGTASDVDTEDTLEYSWSHNSTLTITLDDVLGPSFTAPNVSEDTAVEFTLTVDDGTAQTSDSMTVTITDSENTAPTVDAGNNQTAAEGSTVNLAGTASDVDTEDTLEYSWSHNSTLTITLDDGEALDTSFTAPNVSEDTAVEFTLTVDDGTAQTSDSMTVTITDSANTAPTVNAGNNQEVAEGSTVNLAGTASDVDTEDTLEYSWSHNSTLTITLDDGEALDTSFTAPNVSEDTAVEFTLTVDDGTAQTSDSMTVTITDSANTAPTVDAGNNQTVAEGSTVNLAGTASDVDTEDTLEYSWSHNSTLTITLDDGEALDTSFTAPNVSEDTAVEFTLTVDDGTAQTSDSMTVTITDSANTAPTVNAGNNQEVAEGSTVNLAGTASDVDTEDTLEYSWSHNSTLTITLDDGEALDTSFTAPNVSEDTAVEFTLTVDDGTAQTSDSMTVTITDSANTAPEVNAGNNQEVAEGSTVNLAGTASDVDTEDTLEYSWSHNSTLTITLDDGEALDTSFTAPNVSEDTAVEFTLTVDDGTAQTSDSMVLTITDSANTAPEVNAGNNQEVAEGSTVTLSGNATDADADPLTYAWTHDSSLAIQLANSTSPSTTFTAPAVDADTEITFTLTADDGTANSTDTVLVTVSDVPDDPDFVTTWETTEPGESITIPARGTYTIDWGDGTVDANVRHNQTHEYDTPGNHTVRISKGITVINLNNHADAPKLQSIDQWGDTKWRSMQSSFKGASNMVLHATDAPNLVRTTDMSYMFMHAGSFDGDLSGWDVSGVTDMTGMFYNANSFNGSLSGWDVSGVTDMTGMFYNVHSFNGDISGWDVSGVTDMTGMFYNVHSFNGDLSGWDVSHVTDMYSMFSGASSFDGDLSGWNVSGVTDMNGMFSGASSFDGDISGWDVSGATDMTRMFHNADSFEQNLGPWYIVLDDAAIDSSDIPGEVGRITAQNSFLDGQNPAYGIGSGGDSAHFELDGDILRMTSISDGHEGPYSVTITSTKGFGTDNSRTFDIEFSGFIDNDAPSVDAGPDQTVDEGDTVTLSGNATDADADPLTYAWTHDSDLVLSLSDDAALSTTFTAPAVSADTDVTFTLTVGDGENTVTDTVIVTINHNDAPSVDAGPDQTVDEGDTVTLSGNATDADADSLTYAWTHDSSLAIQLANSTSPSTTFTAPAVDADTEITFTLTADDGTANSTDTVLVTVSGVPGDPDFVTTWETTEPGESITIPARGTYTIDWGDGTVDANVRHNQTHEYDTPGNHTVRISKGITVINLNNHADAPKLQSIDQWGDTKWRSMQSSFKGASNMVLHATDAPNLVRTADMSYMFMHAGSFDGDLSGWDVSGVTGMIGMFYNANSFNGSLSGWNVSGVTDMTGMFYNVHSFNGDISGWDVSGVTDMTGMFYNVHSFNGDISGWDVSGVTDMSSMFSGASSFDGNISAWDVSSVTDMNGMFAVASSFNGNISGWDVSGATDMTRMFHNADSFEQNLGPWYIVLNDAAIDSSDIPGGVGRITAQNSFLDGQNPAYGIGSGGDSAHFELDGGILRMTSVPDGHEGPYSVTITSTKGFGTDNSRTFDISVTEGTGNTPPVAPPDPRGVGQVTVSSTQSGTIQIDWETPSEQPQEYRVTWAKSGENFPDWRDPVGNAFPTDTSQTVTGLEEGEEYQVKVRARYDSGGPGDWSDIITVTIARTQ